MFDKLAGDAFHLHTQVQAGAETLQVLPHLLGEVLELRSVQLKNKKRSRVERVVQSTEKVKSKQHKDEVLLHFP